MILNAEELKQAIQKKLAGGENVRFHIEATLQKSSGPEAEGLVAVTPGKILFAFRPAFGDPEVTVYDRSVLSIVGKQEDLWGASLKAKAADEPFDLKKINPSDFKQLWSELSGETPPVTAELEIKDARQAILGTFSAQTAQPVEAYEPTITNPVEETPPVVGGCYIHAGVAAQTRCDSCGKPICSQCSTPLKFKNYCPYCLADVRRKVEEMKNRTKEVKPPPPPPFSQVRERMAAPSAATYQARSPALAFLFSFMPGFGQFYNKQYGKGFIVLLTFPLVITWIWGFADAVGEANKYNAAIGVTAQPAGCYTTILMIFFLALPVFLTIGFVAHEKDLKKAAVISQPASGKTISQQELAIKREKVRMLLTKYYELQKAHFEENKKFMDEIPAEIVEQNDTGYHFEIIMLGDNRADFRLVAWAQAGDDGRLDLWSVGSGGYVAHEYSADFKP